MTIIEQVGLPAVLEMLGEEGSEMTHASLKWARQLRGENPTPKTEKECRDALVEEVADVQLMIDLLTMSGIIGDAEIRTRMGMEDKMFHKTGESGAVLWRAKGFNSLVFDMTGIDKLTPYTEPDLEQARKEAYEKGLSDAWDCVDKIDSMSHKEQEECFGRTYLVNILEIEPSEAIEKLKAYEQEKKEINVGDEVATDAGNRASVLYENPDGTQVFVFKSDGTAAWWTKSALHRTGRNFPEIAAVLEKMRG